MKPNAVIMSLNSEHLNNNSEKCQGHCQPRAIYLITWQYAFRIYNCMQNSVTPHKWLYQASPFYPSLDLCLVWLGNTCGSVLHKSPVLPIIAHHLPLPAWANPSPLGVHICRPNSSRLHLPSVYLFFPGCRPGLSLPFIHPIRVSWSARSRGPCHNLCLSVAPVARDLLMWCPFGFGRVGCGGLGGYLCGR